MWGEEINTIPKPDPENLKDILEYHQLYDLQIDLKIAKYKDDILQNTDDIIKEIKEYKKKNNKWTKTTRQNNRNIKKC